MAGKNKTVSKKSSSKSRTSSTSQLATPLDSSSNNPSQNVLSSFSPFNDWFAYLTQSVDRHRLQIYTSDDKSRLLADYIIPNAKCECFEWLTLPSPSSSSQQSSKKRRKRQSVEGNNGMDLQPEEESTASQVILALGLSTGSIHLFNPLQGKVVRVLADSITSTSSSASNATSSLAFDNKNTLFACLEDGSVSSWNLQEVLAQDAATTILPTDKHSNLQSSTSPFHQVLLLDSDYIVLAHHSIAIYSLSKREVVATYTGHASNVTHLVSLPSSSSRFVSAAEGDRVVNVWLAPKEGRKTARPLATLPLDAPVSHLSSLCDDAGRDILTVVTAKGSVQLYEVPLDLESQSAPSKGKKSGGIATLTTLTRISVVAKEGEREEIAALNAKLDVQSKVKVARVAKGAKITFESASVQDGSGNFKSDVVIIRGKSVSDGVNGEHLGGSTSAQRYSEAGTSAAQRNGQATSLSGANGLLTGPDDMGALTDDQATLDATIEDLEEPSLGQRLKGLRVRTTANGIVDGEASEEEEEMAGRATLPMGSLSLGQTLTQALHSNDAALLSSCLAHSDPSVIRSSVARLSGPLAVKLLEHCVDRMGRGGKRSTGSLGSARTKGIIEWVRATLIAHTGYLMSLPNLVHRLSALHSTLSNRLASHEKLLALNGRLELVLGQIEMRAAYTAEQAIKIQGVKTKGLKAKTTDKEAKRRQVEGKQWVEESSEEEEEMEEMEVDDEDEEDDNDGLYDVVRGEEEGDTQDIALGNDTLGNTSAESEEDGQEDEEDEEMSEGEEGEDDEEVDDEEDGSEEEDEDASDESVLDEEGDSDDVDDEEDEEDSDENAKGRGGLLDIEAESTDGEGEESEESEE
jgi:U3 small nucleolar RNA-associated protein 5